MSVSNWPFTAVVPSFIFPHGKKSFNAPPLPERPANCGFDIPFFGEMRIMVGRDDEGGGLRPLVVDPLVVSASVPFLSALPSLRGVSFLRYVVDITHIWDYEVAMHDERSLRMFGI